ncbi:MAG: hypothetical protein ACI9N0_002788, partial [Ilumatobacter sp.]
MLAARPRGSKLSGIDDSGGQITDPGVNCA